MTTRALPEGLSPHKHHQDDAADKHAGTVKRQKRSEENFESLDDIFPPAQPLSSIDDFSLTIPIGESSEMDMEIPEPSSPTVRHSMRRSCAFIRSAGAPSPSSNIGRRSVSVAVKSESSENSDDQYMEEGDAMKTGEPNGEDERANEAIEVLKGIIEEKESEIRKLRMEVRQLKKVVELAGFGKQAF
ncbi:hypothetical protein TWF696_003443 [Orbilia brochopaga]|uniref:Uncharacterized protein n=1 Tax=Orbilia brochopaga TaxID=3140254 RepID=A0AAV9U0T0_9PEZI